MVGLRDPSREVELCYAQGRWAQTGTVVCMQQSHRQLREILGVNLRPNLIDDLTFEERVFMLQVHRDREKLKDTLASLEMPPISQYP